MCWPVNQSPGGSSRAWSHCRMWTNLAQLSIISVTYYQKLDTREFSTNLSFISLTLWLLSLGAHQSSGEFSISLGPAHVPRLGFKVSAGGSRHCFASYWLDFPPSGLLFCNVIPLLGEECSVSDGSALKGLFLAAAQLSLVSSHFLRFSYGRALDPSIKWYTGTKWMEAPLQQQF